MNFQVLFSEFILIFQLAVKKILILLDLLLFSINFIRQASLNPNLII